MPKIFLNKTKNIIDLNRFNDDAIASNAKIMIVVKEGDDNLRFQLTEDLTGPEDAALDALVTNFVDSDPEQKRPKILDLINKGFGKDFKSINYKNELSQSLIPKRTTNKGEVIKVEWFKSLDVDNNPTDKVLTVDITYTRDASGFALFRQTTRSWVNRDESVNSDAKTTMKYYFVNYSDQIIEGGKRRKLLVDNIQIPVMMMMMEALLPLGYTQGSVILLGRSFMDWYDVEFNRFVENSSTITDAADPDFGMKSIIVKLRDDAEESHMLWLDKSPGSLGGSITIRQYLMAEFDI